MSLHFFFLPIASLAAFFSAKEMGNFEKSRSDTHLPSGLRGLFSSPEHIFLT